jgi:hypothetical protein
VAFLFNQGATRRLIARKYNHPYLPLIWWQVLLGLKNVSVEGSADKLIEFNTF